MMRPERRFIIGFTTALHTLQAPRRFVATTASKSSGFMRRISWSRVMPALFTAMSSPWCSCTIEATSASTAS